MLLCRWCCVPHKCVLQQHLTHSLSRPCTPAAVPTDRHGLPPARTPRSGSKQPQGTRRVTSPHAACAHAHRRPAGTAPASCQQPLARFGLQASDPPPPGLDPSHCLSMPLLHRGQKNISQYFPVVGDGGSSRDSEPVQHHQHQQQQQQPPAWALASGGRLPGGSLQPGGSGAGRLLAGSMAAAAARQAAQTPSGGAAAPLGAGPLADAVR